MKRIEQKPYFQNDEIQVVNLLNDAIKSIVEAKNILLNTPYMENIYTTDDNIKINKLSKKINHASESLDIINNKLLALDSNNSAITQIFITHLKSKIIGSDLSHYEKPIDEGLSSMLN